MQIPRLPPSEAKRLQVLKSLQIMDTPENERFNRLVNIAHKIFHVPISLVTLLDADRQWFKANVGLEASETPRDISFCGHAILQDGIFIVEDAQHDQRFSDNPLVVGPPNIRFYAGCPLTVGDERLGTLCIIDTAPRKFTAEDLSILKDLAEMVESEIIAYQHATIDELTGLANRRGFIQAVHNGLAICQRQQIESALIYLDLNEFKQINDRFGHSAGDRALQAFADTLVSAVRTGDIVSRIGGDEFVIWLSSMVDCHTSVVLTRVGDLLTLYNQNSGNPYQISFSSGSIRIPAASGLEIEGILEQADQLMYENKRR